MTKFLERIFSTPITADLLIRANEAVNARHESEDGLNPGDAIFVVLSEMRGEISGDLLASVMFRMEALSQIVTSRDASSWTIGINGKGYVLVNEAVFHAAAKAQLFPDGANTVRFDPEEFLALALTYSEGEGNG